MVQPNEKRIVVVGAGMGGLAAAIDLARRGCSVVVAEKGPRAGGKLRQYQVAGRAIDVGPTVLTMRWVFEGLFSDCGRSLGDYVRTRPPEVLARHAWSDGAVLDLYGDPARSEEAIARVFGAEEARGYRAFCDYSARIYDAAREPFLLRQRPSALDLAKLTLRGEALRFTRIDSHRSMAAALSGFFRDPRLQQLFGRYATYCGSSPYLAPATFNLVAHVEREGVHLVEGGMVRLADGLVRLAEELGVRFLWDAPVREIVVQRGRAVGVRLASGELLAGDAVVANADPSAIGGGLFGAAAAKAVPRTPRDERSLSALTFAVVGRAEGLPLVHHNVFFSADYPAEFRALFEARRVPDAPTVYVCAQDRESGEGSFDPENERFFVIVNAPADGDTARFGEEEVRRCERAGFSVMQAAGLRLVPKEVRPTTPRDFDRAFPGSGGALYGAAAHSPLAPLRRQSARTKVPGLYVAGGAAHPGPGVPMAALSGRLASEALSRDLASTRASRPVDMPGSIWTS